MTADEPETVHVVATPSPHGLLYWDGKQAFRLDPLGARYWTDAHPARQELQRNARWMPKHAGVFEVWKGLVEP